MSKNIDIKLQIESINVTRKELKKHFGEHYELGALSNSIPLLEELEKLREGRKENPIVTITINKKDLQKMVDEKVKEIELDIRGIRNKAIDDVFDFLKSKRDKRYMKICFDDLEIKKYKEQLKAGETDGIY